MPPTTKTARQEAEEEEPSYPPFMFTSSEEKTLYKRMKDAFMANYKTWDDEACEAWPHLVEHASLAPSTIGKITNHWITRNMTSTKVTWAHYVALRIIYKGLLFKSKKMMRLIRMKYPRANFSSYAYNEDYTMPFKAEKEQTRPQKTEQEKNPSIAPASQDELSDPLLGKRKRTLPEDTGGKSNAEHRNAPKPVIQKQDKPHAARHEAHDPPAVPNNELPDILEIPAGSSNRRMSHQDMDRDRFMEALETHARIVTENTRALERNTKAVERNSELFARLTEQLLTPAARDEDEWAFMRNTKR
ncbi:hypothetical protein T069G_03262 [Trichoderma breve]|uniref:Uncharacterized protein n=1 Tax=Trichoderma breve TaxID=2034170 RepID=A0A9W9E7W8_9HYPO|nr:hypothetical protein T069G_03262 [Trichoderma breve]KAJ4862308.1 hypothetical protein T069G_03262 [Trichoderma breve]